MPDGAAGGARMVTMPSLRFVRRALAAVAVAGAFVAIALPASAHAELVSSDPADGAAVTELTTIHLEFSEDLLDIGNSITVTDGAGAVHELEVTQPESNVLEAAVGEIASGEVTIAWRNASVDGHTEEGELHVTLVAASPSPSASVSPSASPSAVLTEVGSAPSPSPSPSIEGAASTGVNPWLIGVIGLVVIGGAAAALIAATRRPLQED